MEFAEAMFIDRIAQAENNRKLELAHIKKRYKKRIKLETF